MVQIGAKTAFSRGLFAWIRHRRETTAPPAGAPPARPANRAKRPVTTLTWQVLAGLRGLHYTASQASVKLVYPELSAA
ncbi:hypothetical protein DID96_20615 [Burkholderia sp. Bp8963]|nr:hypothetical protein DID96_20615 [Burkholderia sp. Bp8963]